MSGPDMRFSARIKDPTAAFSIVRTLGKGSFGAVYQAVETATGIEVAIKKLTVIGDDALADTVKEIEIMKACDSPWVVAYYDNFARGDEIWIIMEYLSQGSLTDVLTRRKRVFDEPMIACTAFAVLSGLVYLHAQKKIHRDIKPQNILIGDEGIPKLADFGIAGQLGGDRTRTDTMIGTPYFLAPEIIVNESGYNALVDVWALGISCIQLAEMAPPHSDQNPMRALLLITTSDPPTLKQPEKWSKSFNSFLAKALTKEPSDRPSADKMLQHRFITDNPDPDALRNYIKQLIASGAGAGAGAEFQESNSRPADDDDDSGWSSASASARSSISGVDSRRSSKSSKVKSKSSHKSGKSSRKNKKKADHSSDSSGHKSHKSKRSSDTNDEEPPSVPPPLSESSGMPVCVSCGELIDGKHMVVGESRWHKHHFRCSVCDTELPRDGFVYKEGELYCKPHYHERYSPVCGGCGERITTGGYASALGKSWHPSHLVCAGCKQPFKSGRFIAKNDKPFCDKTCHAEYLKREREHGSSIKSKRSEKRRSRGIAPASAPAQAASAAPASSAPSPAVASLVSERKPSTGLIQPRTKGGPIAGFSEHLNRFAFFKKFYLEACSELGELPLTPFVAYIDASIQLRSKVITLKLGGTSAGLTPNAPPTETNNQVGWTPRALMAAARAIVKVAAFEAPSTVQFSENMAISHIDMSDAGLGPDHCPAIVTLLSCVFPLRSLSFAGNPLLGKKAIADLAEALSRRKSLRRLDLSRSGITDKPLATLLRELTALKKNFIGLDVSHGALTASSGATLGDFVQANPDMLELKASGNKLGDKGTLQLIQRFSQPQHHLSLSVLALSDCGLKKAGSELAQWINENAKQRHSADRQFLAELDVSHNMLDLEFAKWAGQLLATPACPLVMRLSSNKFNSKATRALMDGLLSAKSACQTLKLGGRFEDPTTVELLCQGLRNGGAPALVSLSLRDSQLAPRGLTSLAEAISTPSFGGRLRELDLAFNRVGAEQAAALSSAIAVAETLTELNLAACSMGKKQLPVICNMVKAAPASLTTLHLDGNEWSAALLSDLAVALEVNKTLQVLTLRQASVSSKEMASFVLSLLIR